jgi:beta-lactamase regulating signal transducer with metallopeptidase domain
MTGVTAARDMLWQNGLAVIPLVLIVAGLCRYGRCRPATRHVLWLMVLVWLVLPPLAPAILHWGTAALPQSKADTGLHVSALPDRPGAQVPTDHILQAELLPTPYWLAADTVAEGADQTDALQQEAVAGHIPGVRPPSGSVAPESETPAIDVTTVGVLDACREPVSAKEIAANAPALIPSDWIRRETWGRWWAGLLGVREAVGQLPPLPPWFWLSGIAALLALWVYQALALSRRTARARPAPHSVRRMLIEAGAALGLGRIPEAFMLEAPAAPMLWCLPVIGRPRLILPAALWSQLDERGRRAVIYHELAHLRRRDHWVRWIEAAVGAVYWWHPLVWWVRRHLQEEAELSCDAWVTWLMPKARRTYAEALLHARQVAGSRRASVPAVTLAFTSRRSRTFARRITMVMTESVRPRASAVGLALVTVLAIAGWLAMPAWAAAPQCDKDPGAKCEVKCEAKCAPKCKAPCEEKCDKVIMLRAKPGVPGVPEVPCVPGVPGVPPVRGDLRALRCPPAGDSPLPLAIRLGVGPDDGRIVVLASDDEDDLEARLERLERLVAKLAEKMGAPCEDKPCEKERKREQKREARTRGPIYVPRPAVPRPPAPPKPPARPNLEEQTVREYRLSSEGKLKALTELMARDDVPVLISPMDDAIQVHGTKAQQMIFKAFVDMIDPKKGSESTESAAEKLWKLSYLLGVPSCTESAEAEEGSEAEHRALWYALGGTALSLPEGVAVFEDEPEELREALKLKREALLESQEEERAALEAERESIDDEREAMEEHAAQLERALRQLKEEQRQLEQKRRQLKRMHQRLERRGERDEDEDEDTL